MRPSVKVEPGGATAGGFGPTEIFGGTAMIGLADNAMTAVPPIEPGLHPSADHHSLILEGAVFGLAIGGVYVVGRTLSEIATCYRRRFIL